MNNDIIEDAVKAGFKHALKGAFTINGTLANDSVTHCGYYVLDELTKFAAIRDARKSEQTDAVKDALEAAAHTIELYMQYALKCSDETAKDVAEAIRALIKSEVV